LGFPRLEVCKTCRRLKTKVLTDEASNAVAVEIDYSDWLEIERSLGLQGEQKQSTDLSSRYGVIKLGTPEPRQ
jgi:hypothetical protein